jgi:hypothetical protein
MNQCRIVLILTLLIVAVLLTSACASRTGDNQSERITTPTNPVSVTKAIPLIETKVEPNCTPVVNIANSIISGDPFVYQSQIIGVNYSRNRVWIFGPRTAETVQAIPENKTNYLTIPHLATYPLNDGVYDVIVEYADDLGHFNLIFKRYNTQELMTNQKGDLLLDLSDIKKGRITGKEGADIIVGAVKATKWNQTIERITLNVTKAWIRIDPIDDHIIGDKIPISGTTNIPIGEIIDVEVYSANFKPSEKDRMMETSSLKYAVIPVTKGFCGNNKWNVIYDSTYMKPDLMIAGAAAEKRNASAFQFFNVTQATN